MKEGQDAIRAKVKRDATGFHHRLAHRFELTAGQSLFPGEALHSRNRQYRLEMRRSGQLVLLDRHGRVMWHRGVAQPRYAVSLTLTPQGNLTLSRRGARGVLWESRTSKSGSVLQVQDDGNVVLYAPGHQRAWDTRTQQR